MASLLKLFKAFSKDAQYLPIEHPPYPVFEFAGSEPTEEEVQKYSKVFIDFENEFYAKEVEYENRFEVAQLRMNLCSFLLGFMDPFASVPMSKKKHFKWCPNDAWRRHWRANELDFRKPLTSEK